jgi:hypothetical protein
MACGSFARESREAGGEWESRGVVQLQRAGADGEGGGGGRGGGGGAAVLIGLSVPASAGVG